jgi:predicted HicB family RNase H-like nuclease
LRGFYVFTSLVLARGAFLRVLKRKEQSMKPSKPRYDEQLAVSVPRKMSEAVEMAAAQQFTSASAYIRQAVARSLQNDGFDLSQAS